MQLDGIGRRVVDVIDSDDIFCAIHKNSIAGSKEEQIFSFKRACKTVAAELLVFTAGEDTYTKALRDIFDRMKFQDRQFMNKTSSGYRFGTEALEEFKRSTIVVYNAEDMSDDLITVLARLSDFSIRNDLVFHVFLIGDITKIQQRTLTSKINIERTIPSAYSKEFLI